MTKTLEQGSLWTAASAVAFSGGALILASGVTTCSLFLSILEPVDGILTSKLPDIAKITVKITLQVLGVLISLGAMVVIMGSITFLYRRVSTEDS